MDKDKFLKELTDCLHPVFIVHITKNYLEDCFNSYVQSEYDLLISEQHVDDLKIKIVVSLENINNPWVTIEVEDKLIATGFYACEDPNDVVWKHRIFEAMKNELAKIGISEEFKDAIIKVCTAFKNSSITIR